VCFLGGEFGGFDDRGEMFDAGQSPRHKRRSCRSHHYERECEFVDRK
jgi:hypothetical protein